MKKIKEFLVYIISLPSFNLKFGIAFVIAILFQFTGIAQQQWTPLDPSNIAQLKPAKQSSVHNGGAANRAVDGNTDGNWGAISVTHTQGEDSPWWEVNLLLRYISPWPNQIIPLKHSGILSTNFDFPIIPLIPPYFHVPSRFLRNEITLLCCF